MRQKLSVFIEYVKNNRIHVLPALFAIVFVLTIPISVLVVTGKSPLDFRQHADSSPWVANGDGTFTSTDGQWFYDPSNGQGAVPNTAANSAAYSNGAPPAGTCPLCGNNFSGMGPEANQAPNPANSVPAINPAPNVGNTSTPQWNQNPNGTLTTSTNGTTYTYNPSTGTATDSSGNSWTYNSSTGQYTPLPAGSVQIGASSIVPAGTQAPAGSIPIHGGNGGTGIVGYQINGYSYYYANGGSTTSTSSTGSTNSVPAGSGSTSTALPAGCAATGGGR